MDQPRVTIVIPCFNDEPSHLRQAVESALAQTYPHVEVVVVDDGSTKPETIAALDGLEGVRLVRQLNAGLPAARNAGIRAGTGTVIVPLDADDWLDPQFVTEAVIVLGNPEATIAYPRLEGFGADSRVWGRRGRVILKDFMWRNGIPAASVFRRDSWECCGGYDETMRMGWEDHEFWVRLLSSEGGCAMPLPTAVVHYRVRPGSLMSKKPFAENQAFTHDRMVANASPEAMERMLRSAWELIENQQSTIKSLRELMSDRLALPPSLVRAKHWLSPRIRKTIGR